MMNAIKGTLENGHVVLDGPTNWPEGCRVIVAPERTNEIGWGLTEEDQAEDPEAIRKWLAEFDSIPPLEMTSEEEAEWQTARQAVKSSTREKNLDILERNFRLFSLWPFTVDAANIYGKIYAELRRTGRLIQQIDMQIAAIALSLGNCTVVSSDSDFSVVPGLKVENWASS